MEVKRMALSELQIKNISLSKIGDYIISAIGEGTKQDIYTDIHWASIRDTLLEEYPWNFATQRAELTAGVTTPTWNWAYEYILPTDCIRVLEMAAGTSALFDKTDSYDYRIEGGLLLTNETSPVFVKYIAQITGTSSWPPSFCEAVACKMALQVGEPLAGISSNQRQLLEGEYQEAIGKARGIDFAEGVDDPIGYYSMTSCRDN